VTIYNSEKEKFVATLEALNVWVSAWPIYTGNCSWAFYTALCGCRYSGNENKTLSMMLGQSNVTGPSSVEFGNIAI